LKYRYRWLFEYRQLANIGENFFENIDIGFKKVISVGLYQGWGAGVGALVAAWFGRSWSPSHFIFSSGAGAGAGTL